jgi:hypothetical protein
MKGVQIHNHASSNHDKNYFKGLDIDLSEYWISLSRFYQELCLNKTISVLSTAPMKLNDKFLKKYVPSLNPLLKTLEIRIFDERPVVDLKCSMIQLLQSFQRNIYLEDVAFIDLSKGYSYKNLKVLLHQYCSRNIFLKMILQRPAKQ